jgi:hypothetical protein
VGLGDMSKLKAIVFCHFSKGISGFLFQLSGGAADLTSG